MCPVLQYHREQFHYDSLWPEYTPNHWRPWCLYCVIILPFGEHNNVGIVVTVFANWLLLLSNSHPHVLHIIFWLKSAPNDIPLSRVSHCLYSPNKEYLVASKFGQLQIELLSPFLCSFCVDTHSQFGQRQGDAMTGLHQRDCHVILQRGRSTRNAPLPHQHLALSVCLSHSSKYVIHLALICNPLLISKVEYFPTCLIGIWMFDETSVQITSLFLICSFSRLLNFKSSLYMLVTVLHQMAFANIFS